MPTTSPPGAHESSQPPAAASPAGPAGEREARVELVAEVHVGLLYGLGHGDVRAAGEVLEPLPARGPAGAAAPVLGEGHAGRDVGLDVEQVVGELKVGIGFAV